MNNALLDIYMKFDNAHDIWNALEKKYGGDDARSKRYTVSKWPNFHVEDDKPIIDQIHEIENLCSTMASKGPKICDVTLAIVLSEKLPSS